MYREKAKNLEDIARHNEEWRNSCINLIASENAVSKRVKQALTSDFGCRYAEHDSKGRYYYQGTSAIRGIEEEVEDAFKLIFHCKNAEARPVSGTVANDIVFSELIKYNDLVFTNSTQSGGHISHNKGGGINKYTRNIIPIPLTKDGYHSDAEKTKELILRTKPSVIVLGKSMILFPEPIAELREACEETGTKIIYDGAHPAGLMGGSQFQNPLKEGAHIFTASTHKTFFGPQRGVILSDMENSEWERIEKSAFPRNLSNHHLNTLYALGIACYEFLEFGKDYAIATINNAKTLAESLHKERIKVEAEEFGFTESHQVVLDMEKFGGGKKAADTLEYNNIITSASLLPFESTKEALNPRGIRIGVQEMTRYGMKGREMRHIAKLISEALHGRDVKEEAIKFRKSFQDIKYSFD